MYISIIMYKCQWNTGNCQQWPLIQTLMISPYPRLTVGLDHSPHHHHHHPIHTTAILLPIGCSPYWLADLMLRAVVVAHPAA